MVLQVSFKSLGTGDVAVVTLFWNAISPASVVTTVCGLFLGGGLAFRRWGVIHIVVFVVVAVSLLLIC